MIQALIHHPVGYVIAFLALCALVFVVDHMGLLAWVEWLNRHDRKRKNTASKEYWGMHQ